MRRKVLNTLALAAGTGQSRDLIERRVLPRFLSLGYLMRPKIGRALVLAGWWWLGWHYFAR